MYAVLCSFRHNGGYSEAAEQHSSESALSKVSHRRHAATPIHPRESGDSLHRGTTQAAFAIILVITRMTSTGRYGSEPLFAHHGIL